MCSTFNRGLCPEDGRVAYNVNTIKSIPALQEQSGASDSGCKGPDILQTIKEWTDMTSFEQNQAETKLVSAVWHSSPKWTFWRSFWLLNTFELALVRGEYTISVFWSASGSFLIQQVSGRGTTSQVTSNINTMCRIAELPQIHPHLYDRLRRVFQDSEKVFHS